MRLRSVVMALMTRACWTTAPASGGGSGVGAHGYGDAVETDPGCGDVGEVVFVGVGGGGWACARCTGGWDEMGGTGDKGGVTVVRVGGGGECGPGWL